MNFVSGGTGMVGMHLIAALLKRKEPVRALYREGASMEAVKRFLQYSESDQSLLTWIEGDVLDMPSIEAAIDGCRCVYHAAAVVSFHKADRNQMYDVNINGTANMVNAALAFGVEDFVYISSVASLGRNINGLPVDEDAEWKDGPELSHYARTKHMAEREVWRGSEEGLRVVIVNPSVILGIGDFNRSSAEIFKQVDRGLPFYPPGSNGFVGVQDVVAACFHLLDGGHHNRRYLLSTAHLSFNDLFGRVAKLLDVKPPKKKAGKWLMQLGRIFAWLLERISGRKAFITKESVRNAGHHHRYNTNRIADTGFAFTPIDVVLEETAAYYRQMKSEA